MKSNPIAIRSAAQEYLRGRNVLRDAFPEMTPKGLEQLALVLAGAPERPAVKVSEPVPDVPPQVKRPKGKTKIVKAAGTKTKTVKASPTKIVRAVEPVAAPKPAAKKVPVVSLVETDPNVVCVDVGPAKIPMLHVVAVLLERAPERSATLNSLIERLQQLGWPVLTRNPDPRYSVRASMKRRSDAFVWHTIQAAGDHRRDMSTLREGVDIPADDRAIIEDVLRTSLIPPPLFDELGSSRLQKDQGLVRFVGRAPDA
jgi:hypothetical protein